LPAAKIEELAGTASANSAYVVGPMVDGAVIPEQPLSAFAAGRFNHVPLINGNVEDEQNFTLAIDEYFESPQKPLTAAQYKTSINTSFAPPNYPAGTAAAVLAQYPVSAYSSAQLAWDREGTDMGICSEHHLDQILGSQIALYTYEFDDQTAPFYFPKMPGFTSLAYHTSDIQYLFPLWSGGPDGIVHQLNAKQKTLSSQLVAAWTNFAWSGNPNGVGNKPWPRYKGTNGLWLRENILPAGLTTTKDSAYSAERHCGFWDKVLGYNS
jgi:para-nitrobenzyl esterase